MSLFLIPDYKAPPEEPLENPDRFKYLAIQTGYIDNLVNRDINGRDIECNYDDYYKRCNYKNVGLLNLAKSIVHGTQGNFDGIKVEFVYDVDYKSSNNPNWKYMLYNKDNDTSLPDRLLRVIKPGSIVFSFEDNEFTLDMGFQIVKHLKK